MTKNLSIEELTRDILKNSFMDLSDDNFNAATMARIIRENRKYHIIENALLFFLVFLAIDTFILLLMWLTGLNVFDVATAPAHALSEILLQAGRLQNSIIDYPFIKYFMISLGGLIVIFNIGELKLNSWKGRRGEAEKV
ncbi:MAG TPA: hypothetical protein VLX91_08455 [Candidatus Acidoferrales bacterium]|nr:hypothetical protein [Candidatus Acidoferrales bacterium]